MYTLTITGETICEIIGKLDKRINEFESLSEKKLKNPSPITRAEREAQEKEQISKKAAEVREKNGVKKEPIDPVPVNVSEAKVETGAEPTFTDIKNQILELAKVKGRNASLEVLKMFQDKNGVACEKITALMEKDYSAVMAEAKKLLEA